MDEKAILHNLKALRANRKMSLERLAKLSGLTKGYISKIERAEKAPPFSTLIKIASALDTNINFLLNGNLDVPKDLPLCVVKRNERKKGTIDEYSYEALAQKKLGKNMEPYIFEPSFEEKPYSSHEGEEFFYVLEGEYKFVFDEEEHLLKAGDSVYFESRYLHSGMSVGDKKAKVLAVTYSYKRG